MDDLTQIQSVMSELDPQDLANILIEKFDIERMNRFFSREQHSIPAGKVLNLDSTSSLLLKFETLQKEFPEDYKDFSSYKLLLILNFGKSLNEGRATDSDFDVKLQNDLLTIHREHGVNKVVIWSLAKMDPGRTRILKSAKTDLLYIDCMEVKDTRFISNFFPHPSNDYDYVVILNKVADLLIKRLKKLFHLVLSEIAAPIYNRHYGKTKVATNSVMEFEESILQGLIQRLKKSNRNSLAIDIGCGTGRHSFLLAEFFQSVKGYDISPKMIKEAGKVKQNRQSKGLPHDVVFTVSDFEYEEVLDEEELQGKVDLMVLSFGMGSFIENTTKMLKRCHDWLAPGGYVFFSFYNSSSIVLQVTPNWRDTALSAHLDVDDHTLRVELTPDIIFQIYCKAFDNDIKSEITGLFNIEKIYSYPTVMALLPNNVLESRLGRDLFSFVDKELTKSGRYNNLGHYMMLVAQKPAAMLTGYANLISILKNADCDYQVIDHSPVFSIKDIMTIMDLPGEAILKTVVFSYKEESEKKLVSVSIQAKKRVNKGKLAQVLQTNPNILKFAAEKQITSLGFPIGGIAPLGFREDAQVRSFVDSSVFEIEEDWLYTGIGDNKKTLKIRRKCFLRTIQDYERIDVAEPDPGWPLQFV